MAILGEANKIFANQNEYFELVYRLVTEEYYGSATIERNAG